MEAEAAVAQDQVVGRRGHVVQDELFPLDGAVVGRSPLEHLDRHFGPVPDPFGRIDQAASATTEEKNPNGSWCSPEGNFYSLPALPDVFDDPEGEGAILGADDLSGVQDGAVADGRISHPSPRQHPKICKKEVPWCQIDVLQSAAAASVRLAYRSLLAADSDRLWVFWKVTVMVFQWLADVVTSFFPINNMPGFQNGAGTKKMSNILQRLQNSYENEFMLANMTDLRRSAS